MDMVVKPDLGIGRTGKRGCGAYQRALGRNEREIHTGQLLASKRAGRVGDNSVYSPKQNSQAGHSQTKKRHNLSNIS